MAWKAFHRSCLYKSLLVALLGVLAILSGIAVRLIYNNNIVSSINNKSSLVGDSASSSSSINTGAAPSSSSSSATNASSSSFAYPRTVMLYVHVFNYTNPQQATDVSTTMSPVPPKAQLVGPFIYVQSTTRFNLSVSNDLDMLSFSEDRRFTYTPTSRLPAASAFPFSLNPSDTSITSVWLGYLSVQSQRAFFVDAQIPNVISTFMNSLSSLLLADSLCVSGGGGGGGGMNACDLAVVSQWGRLSPKGSSYISSFPPPSSSSSSSYYPEYAGWVTNVQNDPSLLLTDTEAAQVLTGTYSLFSVDTTGIVGSKIDPGNPLSSMVTKGMTFCNAFLWSRSATNDTTRSIFASLWGISSSKAAALQSYLFYLRPLGAAKLGQVMASAEANLTLPSSRQRGRPSQVPFVQRSAQDWIFDFADPLLSAVLPSSGPGRVSSRSPPRTFRDVNSAWLVSHTGGGDANSNSQQDNTFSNSNYARIPAVSLGNSDTSAIARTISWNSVSNFLVNPLSGASTAGAGAWCAAAASSSSSDYNIGGAYQPLNQHPPSQQKDLGIYPRIDISQDTGTIQLWDDLLLRSIAYEKPSSNSYYLLRTKRFTALHAFDRSTQFGPSVAGLANMSCPSGLPLYVSFPYLCGVNTSSPSSPFSSVSDLPAQSSVCSNNNNPFATITNPFSTSSPLVQDGSSSFAYVDIEPYTGKTAQFVQSWQLNVAVKLPGFSLPFIMPLAVITQHDSMHSGEAADIKSYAIDPMLQRDIISYVLFGAGAAAFTFSAIFVIVVCATGGFGALSKAELAKYLQEKQEKEEQARRMKTYGSKRSNQSQNSQLTPRAGGGSANGLIHSVSYSNTNTPRQGYDVDRSKVRAARRGKDSGDFTEPTPATAATAAGAGIAGGIAVAGGDGGSNSSNLELVQVAVAYDSEKDGKTTGRRSSNSSIDGGAVVANSLLPSPRDTHYRASSPQTRGGGDQTNTENNGHNTGKANGGDDNSNHNRDKNTDDDSRESSPRMRHASFDRSVNDDHHLRHLHNLMSRDSFSSSVAAGGGPSAHNTEDGDDGGSKYGTLSSIPPQLRDQNFEDDDDDLP